MQSENEIRNKMVQTGRSFFERGLSGGSSGNMSALLPDGCLLVTPTGSSLGGLIPERLSKISPNGEHISGDKPTKEVFMHQACYASRPDCKAVVHLHSPYAVAISCLADLQPDDCLPAITPYFVMRIGSLPLAPYIKPGSEVIGEQIRTLLPGRVAVLLANHGPVVTGKSLDDAANNSEELEDSCRLFLMLKGHKVRLLTEEERLALINKN
ncbi:3-oxo-tetronate 4-phosphate decarboxylase [Desulfovibrio litoralis]|uniref:3-oxo-tetronate 4-phosphate decarboxylase n=1 Tax=Desulfovibrio litoralis DSM 11393 TaxID=1121455 RepID=A0A1M7TMP0_9BACT|nr:3-oxo-tetronate 4-phosphate decarboxylase [Desulfovibrio litoralis]SHN71918.1 Ribulose-5-phosphate 4-epimerase/Fuculose-1-phosphate aldolase [Desulfovibrio litoralis DSM 11393]